MMKTKKEQGYSLIELIIGMMIMVIILGAIYTTLTSALRSHQYNFESAANIQDERTILLKITEEVKNAVQISIPDDTILIYKKSGELATSRIEMGTGSDSHTILFTDSSGNTAKFASGRAGSLKFEAISPREIRISLTVNNNQSSKNPINNISTVVYTLN